MPYPQTSETNLRRIVTAVRELWEGRSHAAGSFTIDADAGTTTVTAMNCAPTSQVFLQAKTATAAAEIAAGGIYVSSIGQGQFVVTHSNDPDDTRTFSYAIRG